MKGKGKKRKMKGKREKEKRKREMEREREKRKRLVSEHKHQAPVSLCSPSPVLTGGFPARTGEAQTCTVQAQSWVWGCAAQAGPAQPLSASQLSTATVAGAAPAPRSWAVSLSCLLCKHLAVADK